MFKWIWRMFAKHGDNLHVVGSVVSFDSYDEAKAHLSEHFEEACDCLPEDALITNATVALTGADPSDFSCVLPITEHVCRDN